MVPIKTDEFTVLLANAMDEGLHLDSRVSLR
jgi:hypothetical protein